jgi:hypothetical protein
MGTRRAGYGESVALYLTCTRGEQDLLTSGEMASSKWDKNDFRRKLPTERSA